MSDDEKLAQQVIRNGWHALSSAPSETTPPYTYTVGLCHTFGNPELILFGFDARTAHSVLSTLVEQIRNGQAYTPGRRYSGILAGYDIFVGAVHPSQLESRLPAAVAYYKKLADPDVLHAIQIFFPDKSNKFPGDPGCDPEVSKVQPKLDTPLPGSHLRLVKPDINLN